MWPNLQFPADLVTFTEKILNEKPRFCAVEGFRFLLCVIDIYSKYPWVIPLKDKNGTTMVLQWYYNAFEKNLNE